jgi:hypothetical protein
LEGAGRLKALDLKASSTVIKQYYYSSASLGGEVESLAIEISDSALLEAYNLKALEIEAELSDQARAEVYPIDRLKARSSDSSRLLYINEPKEIERLIFDDGEIKKAAEWEKLNLGAGEETVF